MMGGILFVFLILLMVISLILGFTSFGRSNTGSLILSGFGALLFAVYLICKWIHTSIDVNFSFFFFFLPHQSSVSFNTNIRIWKHFQTTHNWLWAVNVRIHWHQKSIFWVRLCSIWISSISSYICWEFCQRYKNKYIARFSNQQQRQQRQVERQQQTNVLYKINVSYDYDYDANMKAKYGGKSDFFSEWILKNVQPNENASKKETKKKSSAQLNHRYNLSIESKKYLSTFYAFSPFSFDGILSFYGDVHVPKTTTILAVLQNLIADSFVYIDRGPKLVTSGDGRLVKMKMNQQSLSGKRLLPRICFGFFFVSRRLPYI